MDLNELKEKSKALITRRKAHTDIVEELLYKVEFIDKSLQEVDKQILELEKPKRWRAEFQGEYWIVRLSSLEPHRFIEYGDADDNRWYKSGNYFQTEADAQEIVDKILELFKNQTL